MATATSMPELFVGVMSGLEGEGSLAFGTSIGSNIADVALILAILLIINGTISVKGAITRRESVWVAILAMLPVLLILDKTLSRIDGVILILAFVLYVWQLLKSSHFFQKVEQAKDNHRFWIEVGKVAISIVVLLVASRFTVIYAKDIALSLSVPIFLVGILLAPIATTLPELIFAIKSSQKNTPKLSLGDIVGSIVFNATIVLGISSLINPIVIDGFSKYIISAVALFLVIAYFVYANYQNKVLSRNWGIALIAFYLLFLIAEISL